MSEKAPAFIHLETQALHKGFNELLSVAKNNADGMMGTMVRSALAAYQGQIDEFFAVLDNDPERRDALAGKIVRMAEEMGYLVVKIPEGQDWTPGTVAIVPVGELPEEIIEDITHADQYEIDGPSHGGGLTGDGQDDADALPGQRDNH